MRSPLSSRTNSRPERVVLDEVFDLVASSVVMVFPSVSRLRGLNLPFVSLYLTQRGCHRELSVLNRAELLRTRRRSTYAGSGKINGRLAFLSCWSTIFCRAVRLYA